MRLASFWTKSMVDISWCLANGGGVYTLFEKEV
jgi:hypothetical protein